MGIHNYKPMGPGERFGFWKTIDKDGIFRGKSKIHVICGCGRKGYVRLTLLRSGKSRGCTFCGGMWRRKIIKAGDVAGNWRVVSGSSFDGYAHTVEVECVCGGERKTMPAGTFRTAQKRKYIGGCKKCSLQAKIDKMGDVFGRYLLAALGNKIEITAIQLKTICQMGCFYCGIGPTNELRVRRKILDSLTFKYSGVDEVEYGAGHVVGNLLPCCIDCNKAKNNHTLEYFCEWFNRRRDARFHLAPDKIRKAARELGEDLAALLHATSAGTTALEAVSSSHTK